MTTKQVDIRSATPDTILSRRDFLTIEDPLEISLLHGLRRKRFQLAVTMRTPGHDEDLVAGFLFTEGVIGGARDIAGWRLPEENRIVAELRPGLVIDESRLSRHVFAASSCGICGKAALDAVQTIACYFPQKEHPHVKQAVLYALPDRLRAAQTAFEATGGLHAAALFDVDGRLLLSREDVGRHNAVDKVLGAALRAGWPLPFRDHLLLVSGRAGFELVQKASMAGIPLLAAVGAPSSLAVEMAETSGMTLLGFLREARFNIYAGAERIEGKTQ
jgi:FdhD protein